jgi:hypothetical protein
MLVERRLGLDRGADDWQAVSVEHKTTPRRPKSEVGSSRQTSAERLPVQPAIKESEILRIDVVG